MKRMVQIFAMLLISILACSTVSGATSNDPVQKVAFMKSAFYTSGQVKVAKDEAISQLHPELVPFSFGDGYLYWTAENGKVEMITLEENEIMNEDLGEEQDCDKSIVAQTAKELFDKAFEMEEEQFGNMKSVRIAGGGMNAYIVTVNLLWRGKETGNSASIVVSKSGKLMAAAFVYGELTTKELEQSGVISEDDAVRIAEDSVREYTDSKSIVIASVDDKVEISDVEYRVFRETRFYAIKGQVLFAVPQKWGTSDMPFEIRVNVDTGECVEIATILE